MKLLYGDSIEITCHNPIITQNCKETVLVTPTSNLNFCAHLQNDSQSNKHIEYLYLTINPRLKCLTDTLCQSFPGLLTIYNFFFLFPSTLHENSKLAGSPFPHTLCSHNLAEIVFHISNKTQFVVS